MKYTVEELQAKPNRELDEICGQSQGGWLSPKDVTNKVKWEKGKVQWDLNNKTEYVLEYSPTTEWQQAWS